MTMALDITLKSGYVGSDSFVYGKSRKIHNYCNRTNHGVFMVSKGGRMSAPVRVGSSFRMGNCQHPVALSFDSERASGNITYGGSYEQQSSCAQGRRTPSSSQWSVRQVDISPAIQHAHHAHILHGGAYQVNHRFTRPCGAFAESPVNRVSRSHLPQHGVARIAHHHIITHQKG